MTRQPTTIRLTPEQLRAIDAAAEAQGISRSQWITNAIDAALSGTLSAVTTCDYGSADAGEFERRLSAIERQLLAITPPVGADQSKPAAAPRTPQKSNTPPAAMARLFELKDAGESHVTTAARLNAEGHKRSTGIGWDAAAVGVMWKQEQQRRKERE